MSPFLVLSSTGTNCISRPVHPAKLTLVNKLVNSRFGSLQFSKVSATNQFTLVAIIQQMKVKDRGAGSLVPPTPLRLNMNEFLPTAAELKTRKPAASGRLTLSILPD